VTSSLPSHAMAARLEEQQLAAEPLHSPTACCVLGIARPGQGISRGDMRYGLQDNRGRVHRVCGL